MPGILPIFLIGRYADAAVLQMLLGLENAPRLLPARVTGFNAVAFGEDFEVLLPSANKDAVVDGMAYFPQDTNERRVLENTLSNRYCSMSNVGMTLYRGWRKYRNTGRVAVYTKGMTKLKWDIAEMKKVMEEQKGTHPEGEGNMNDEERKNILEFCRNKVYKKVWDWLVGVDDSLRWED